MEHKLGSFLADPYLVHYKETSFTNGLRLWSHYVSIVRVYSPGDQDDSPGDQDDSRDCPQLHYTKGKGNTLLKVWVDKLLP